VSAVPEVIPEPARIPVPGGKVIDEYVGRVATPDAALSVARMSAPAGWTEPGQTPEFDEVTLVLSGSVVVEHAGGAVEVRAGQAVVTRAGGVGPVRGRTGRRRVRRRLRARVLPGARPS
jgi:mannose-6-phosphate isomerase-like protein (cupin superfamily)